MQWLYKHGLLLIVLIIAVLVMLITYGFNLYGDFLWFTSMDYLSVFYITVLSSVGLQIVSFVFLFLFFFMNLMITRKTIKLEEIYVDYDNQNTVPIRDYVLKNFLNPRNLVLVYFFVSFFFAFMLSGITSGQWLTVQSFLNAVDFGTTEPVFNKDLSFYLFELPFYNLIYVLFMSAVIGSGVMVGLMYFLFTPRANFSIRAANFKQPQVHLSILIALFFILQAWNFRLSAYELLISKRGAVFGVGYTDITAQLPAFNILSIIALILAVLIFVSIFLRIYKIIIASVALLIISSILLGSLFPNAIQKFTVEPNEFAREQVYLEREIEFTRQGYNLDKIEIMDFPLDRELTAEHLENNQNTINNIRLWDYRPLRQTFEQLQTLRLYYQFNDVDIDRYWIDGEYRQVMLSARELDQNLLQEQAKTWVNERLRYTHGYGVVVSAVNETTPEGLPKFLVKDIPVSPISEDLKIEQPSIYFGELTDNNVIVKSDTKEFHYPAGNDNVETTYEGTGGVAIDNIFKRMFFALYHGDFRLFLTSELNEDSRLLYNRGIDTIVEKIAPFLQYDNDPYIVISEGRLFWIRDAYTTTNMYPYSQPLGKFNYIRNSVKVVTDAYNGTTKFYICDTDDPIIQTYSSIFPELFEPISEMPYGLTKHIRYPAKYFNIQSNMLTLYHMQNPQVFYNREDAWSIPDEIFQGEKQAMEPYYMVMQLPKNDEPEYILMLPFVPLNRANMVSWLIARNDGDNYGEMILYQFPKESHVFGPMQIEGRIDQDSYISQQLSLWDQRGSQVLRGNLLVIPIENSLLYVEPIFLQAEQSKIPELRRVIVAYGDQIVMEETLEESLISIFGTYTESPDGQEIPGMLPGITKDQAQLIELANQLFNDARTKQQAGDWAGYGEAISELEKTLEDLKGTSENLEEKINVE